LKPASRDGTRFRYNGSVLPYEFRVTKYDPALRDESGAFVGEDWTSVSEIGTSVAGKQLTLARYLDVEARHLIAVAGFLDESGVEAVRVDGLYQDGPRYSNGQQLRPLEAIEAVRLNLREQLDCGLEAEG
jgi:hypothetical protein